MVYIYVYKELVYFNFVINREYFKRKYAQIPRQTAVSLNMSRLLNCIIEAFILCKSSLLHNRLNPSRVVKAFKPNNKTS